jgi:hypothetical protein
MYIIHISASKSYVRMQPSELNLDKRCRILPTFYKDELWKCVSFVHYWNKGMSEDDSPTPL